MLRVQPDPTGASRLVASRVVAASDASSSRSSFEPSRRAPTVESSTRGAEGRRRARCWLATRYFRYAAQLRPTQRIAADSGRPDRKETRTFQRILESPLPDSNRRPFLTMAVRLEGGSRSGSGSPCIGAQTSRRTCRQCSAPFGILHYPLGTRPPGQPTSAAQPRWSRIGTWRIPLGGPYRRNRRGCLTPTRRRARWRSAGSAPRASGCPACGRSG
jgi:hypothetical protein